MGERWIPEPERTEVGFGTEQLLYAVLGPALSQQLVELIRMDKGGASPEMIELVGRLEDEIGRAPAQLIYMGVALAALEMTMNERSKETETADRTNEALFQEIGWDALKMFGSGYVSMFERFGFSGETIRLFMERCVHMGHRFDWPPPGVACRPVDDLA